MGVERATEAVGDSWVVVAVVVVGELVMGKWADLGNEGSVVLADIAVGTVAGQTGVEVHFVVVVAVQIEVEVHFVVAVVGQTGAEAHFVVVVAAAAAGQTEAEVRLPVVAVVRSVEVRFVVAVQSVVVGLHQFAAAGQNVDDSVGLDQSEIVGACLVVVAVDFGIVADVASFDVAAVDRNGTEEGPAVVAAAADGDVVVAREDAAAGDFVVAVAVHEDVADDGEGVAVVVAHEDADAGGVSAAVAEIVHSVVEIAGSVVVAAAHSVSNGAAE